MTKQVPTTTTVPAKNAPKVPNHVERLQAALSADSVRSQFVNAVGKNSGAFVASLIDLYNSDSSLKQCDPNAVIREALRAAVLHLPITKALGYAFIIPYTKKKKDENGREYRVKEPSFQIGYKGLIQLAQRTGQYRTINADVIYEGEMRKVSKLTGEVALDGEKKSDKVVGYFAYFELLNGFRKTLFVMVEDMAKRAKAFSQAIKYDSEVTVDTLLNLAKLPVTEYNGKIGWTGNFHDMAIKTCLRSLLSKYGYLSVEMQNAIQSDDEPQNVDFCEDTASDRRLDAGPQDVNFEDATFVEVGAPAMEAEAEQKRDCGF